MLDFVKLALNRPNTEIIATVLAWAGDTAPMSGKRGRRPLAIHRPTATAIPSPSPVHPLSAPVKPPPSLSDVKPLLPAEAELISMSRRLPPEACDFPGACGYLVAAQDEGWDFIGWVLLDAPGWPAPRPGGPFFPSTTHVAEMRRLDRRPFAHGAKAHTLPGSRKNWPIGLSALAWAGWRWRVVLAVEGGPDFLAAQALLAALNVSDVLPIALLSRELRHLHDDAAALLRGRHVHILPHNDADTDEREFHHGQTAAEQWASTLFYEAGAERVTFATLECLTRPDGQPAKDLCDAMEEDGVDRNRAHLRHLLPFDY